MPSLRGSFERGPGASRQAGLAVVMWPGAVGVPVGSSPYGVAAADA
ncbi:MAG: hypothetical protein RBR41_06500 [Desulfovibrio sp.]|nr:hypothetical protein [Desulfovibrio sp.]MDY0259303.1 hypothetical protein [Desulfovibrio sp.]